MTQSVFGEERDRKVVGGKRIKEAMKGERCYRVVMRGKPDLSSLFCPPTVSVYLSAPKSL